MTKADLLAILADPDLDDDAPVYMHLRYEDDVDQLVDDCSADVVPSEHHDDGVVEKAFVVIRQNAFDPLA